MTPEDFQKEVDKQNADKQAKETDVDKQQSVEQAKNHVIDAMVQSTKANMRHREKTTVKTDIQNPIAEREDIAQAVSAINNLAILMLGQNQQSPTVNMIDGTDLGQRFADLGKTLTDLLTEVKNDASKDNGLQNVVKQLDAQLKQLKNLQIAPDKSVGKSLANIEQALKSIDLKPSINVPTPKVTVQGKDVDLSPLVNLLNNISDTLKKLPTDNDNSEIIIGLEAIQSSINNLTFPVPNYVLPFKDSTGKATQVTLNSDGSLPTSGGGGSGGTQYASGTATPGVVTGNALIFDDAGTLENVSTTNPLPVNASVTITGVATSANQTNGSQVTQVQDSSGNPLQIAQGATTSGQTGPLVLGSVTTSAPTYTAGEALPLNLTVNGSLRTSVTSIPALVAGSAIIGNVRIDQTTPGTTNGVQVNAALPAGTNVIGHVITDSGSTTAATQSGTWSVGSNSATGSAFPANAFLIGMADTTNLVPLKSSVIGDGVSSGTSYLATTSYVWNGTTYDKTREANAAAATTGTGLQGAGNLIFDGTNWQKQTTTTAIGVVGTISAVINVGQQTVNTTAVQLSGTSTVPTNGIIIQALSTNAASVFVGGSSVTTSTGFELQAGQSMSFTANLNTIYIISVASTTDKVCYNVE